FAVSPLGPTLEGRSFRSREAHWGDVQGGPVRFDWRLHTPLLSEAKVLELHRPVSRGLRNSRTWYWAIYSQERSQGPAAQSRHRVRTRLLRSEGSQRVDRPAVVRDSCFQEVVQALAGRPLVPL